MNSPALPLTVPLTMWRQVKIVRSSNMKLLTRFVDTFFWVLSGERHLCWICIFNPVHAKRNYHSEDGLLRSYPNSSVNVVLCSLSNIHTHIINLLHFGNCFVFNVQNTSMSGVLVLHFASGRTNIWHKFRDKQEEQQSAAEQTWGLGFPPLWLWLRLRSPCQHMSWPRVLTAVLRGFHQAPRDLPTVQTTATLIVHCAATFLQSASRILRSLTLYSILKVSYHLWCQVKPVPRTRTLHISLRIQPPDT